MVAVRHWEADKLLQRLPDHIGFYLFYGPDAGLVNERARLVAHRSIDDPNDAFQLIRLEGDEVAGEPGRLADEVNTMGLFGGRRAVWLRAGARNLVPAFEAVVDARARDCTVVVEAGALKRDSALRKLFEREKHCAAVECAHDSPEQLRALIESEAKAAGAAIDRETAELLVHSLGADRLTTRSELGKLLLFTHGQARITEQDVGAIVADAAALNLEAAINALFSGQMERLDETIAHALQAGSDPGMLVAMAARHANMLHRARLDVEAGMMRDAAIEKWAKRSFIFTRKDTLAGQFERWPAEALLRAIRLLAQTVQECRKDARLADVALTRAFWTLANAARRAARR